MYALDRLVQFGDGTSTFKVPSRNSSRRYKFNRLPCLLHRHLAIDITRPIYVCRRNLLTESANFAAENVNFTALLPSFSINTFIAKNSLKFKVIFSHLLYEITRTAVLNKSEND